MINWLDNITLEGNKATLAPLDGTHKNELLAAAEDGKLWELWYTSVPSAANIDNYIEFALKTKEQGTSYPFVIIDKAQGKIIGSTRYCNATPEHRRLEIGYTWYAKSRQRTGINTECKLLLLSYAFEALQCIAVEFRTNWFNLQSRNAIASLGAKQDGILRNHKINPDGTFRDTVVFSITQEEWPSVKKSLLYKLEKYNLNKRM
ncbi:GNAT family N-acetyltransferase [Zhouia amylolytica]|uniref:Amino-acid acetyltransferase n=1 Tax=Zhouia amylolytica AD3 TaxID=1286632 RepID=W2UIK9_9FLAO|nr:GNAT family protein [Zhouia amylolytica]ETN93843.1 amino-acid acetyltransferase [Zhouia amylolytica AD3]